MLLVSTCLDRGIGYVAQQYSIIITIILHVYIVIYRLDGPGIESRWRRNLPHPSTPALVPTQPPMQEAPGFFSRGKAAAGWL